jgi:hypothetical protein
VVASDTICLKKRHKTLPKPSSTSTRFDRYPPSSPAD